MKPAFRKQIYIAHLEGRYMVEEKLVTFFQKKGGEVDVYLLPLANGGIHDRLEFAGSVKASKYHCDHCIADLTIDEIETVVKDYCERTYQEASDEEFDEGSFYRFVKITIERE